MIISGNVKRRIYGTYKNWFQGDRESNSMFELCYDNNDELGSVSTLANKLIQIWNFKWRITIPPLNNFYEIIRKPLGHFNETWLCQCGIIKRNKPRISVKKLIRRMELKYGGYILPKDPGRHLNLLILQCTKDWIKWNLKGTKDSYWSSMDNLSLQSFFYSCLESLQGT